MSWHLSDQDRDALGMYARSPDGANAEDLSHYLGVVRATGGQIQTSLWERGYLVKTGKYRRTAHRGDAELYELAPRRQDPIAPSKARTYAENVAALGQLKILMRCFARYDQDAKRARDRELYLETRFKELYGVGDSIFRSILREDRKRQERGT